MATGPAFPSDSQDVPDMWRLPTLELRLLARSSNLPHDGLKEEVLLRVNPFVPVTFWALGETALRRLAGSLELPTSGSRAELIER